jgi:hypothetical protein
VEQVESVVRQVAPAVEQVTLDVKTYAQVG